MIEYLYTEGRSDVAIGVRLSGRVSGEIRPVEGGWQYVPVGQKHGGEVFATVDACQRSLKGED